MPFVITSAQTCKTMSTELTLSPEALALARLAGFDSDEEMPAATATGLDDPDDLSAAELGLHGSGIPHTDIPDAVPDPWRSGEASALPDATPSETPPDETSIPLHQEQGLVSSRSGVTADQGAPEEEVADPRKVRTKVGLANHPLSKFALIGGGGLLLFGSLGIFLITVTGSRPPKPSVVATPSPTPSQDANAQGTDDSSKYKTEAALSAQKLQLSQVQPKPSPSPTATATPVTTVPTPLAATPLAPLLPLVPTPLSSTPVSPQQEKDPIQQWQEAARLGSYGRVSMSGGSTGYGSVPATSPVSPFTPTVPAVAPVTTAGTSGGATPLASLRSASTTPGLRDKPLAPVLVGSSARAAFMTAIVLAGDNTTPTDPTNPAVTKYLVQLKDDLKDADGNTALPQGAQLVVATKTFSPQSGLAEFQVVSVIVNNREYTAPSGAMVIRSTNGGEIALSKQGKGNGLFQSILPAFFAGVSQAGQILNQPSSSATVSGGSVSATTTSSNPSPLAGFAQGFGQNISQSLQQKAQAANQAQQSQPNAWSIGAGTAVTLFVNSSFQM